MELYDPKLAKKKGASEKHLKSKQPNILKKFYNNKKLFFISCGSFFALLLLVLYLNGLMSFAIPIFPVVDLGTKTNTLNCNYSNKKLSIDVKVASNKNNFYHYMATKDTSFNKGEFTKFVYSNSNDQTIKKLAEEIKELGKSNNLNADQIVELATCFVQNIPYDDVKANLVLRNQSVSSNDIAQYPYETLFKNSGICTDKTYLGSALLKEMGYGTALLVFIDAQHMALGIKAPTGYTDFQSKYAYMEMTNPGFAPGEVPSDINDSDGKAAVSINSLNEISASADPSTLNIDVQKSITDIKYVLDVNDGQSYQRIVPVRNLEKKITSGLTTLASKRTTLNSAYQIMTQRDGAQQNAYSYYLSLPSTKLDCGYKYNYYYSYLYSSSYSSPYTYRCDTVTNSQKNSAYTSYTYALSSYNSQVGYYNKLVDDFNSSLRTVKSDINSYKSHSYN